MELKLVVLAGAKEGLEIPLKKDKFLIGRAKDCALRAGSEAISRRHCAIIHVKDKWAVKDLGSRNGTYVNNKRIEQPVRLNPGDELSVGPLKFRVTTAQPAATSAKATPAASASSTAAPQKPRKQPPVKNVADVVERSRARDDDSASEEDITRWLLGVPDEAGVDTLKETRTIRLEETKAHGRLAPPADESTVDDIPPIEDLEQAEQEAVNGDVGDEPEEGKKSGWGLFKRGKGTGKAKPGKLPPRPEQASKDSREAAADILREMTRRR